MFNWIKKLFTKEKINQDVYIEILQRTDPRLGRNVRHDSRSLDFPFDTTGLEVKSITHERFIPILNQGDLGSCTGNAGVGIIHTAPFLNKENAIYPGNEQGAIKLYSDATALDPYSGTYPPEDTGSDGLSIAKALKNAGLIEAYYHTFTLEDALKALTKYPLLIGTTWYSDMFHPDRDTFIHPTGSVAGGHQYIVRQNVAEEGYLWVDNSWDRTWGIEGRAKITWVDFKKLLDEKGDVIVLIPKTDIPTILTPSQKCYDLVKVFEGFSAKPYKDVGGKYTIGYGSTCGADGKPITVKSKVLTKAQASALLVRDMEITAKAINTLVKVPLAQNQYDAVCSMVYNIGIGAFKGSALLRNLNTKSVIKRNFTDWKLAGGKVIPGLLARREKEYALFVS